MKTLKVNENTCIGCGACIAIDPEHFDFNDNLSQVISNDNLDSNNLINAIESCPTNAINIEE
ncbi:MAG: ferredoxin [Firmicutes bacterium]|nr:ferredoxin [Bacillota bacterium]